MGVVAKGTLTLRFETRMDTGFRRYRFDQLSPESPLRLTDATGRDEHLPDLSRFCDHSISATRPSGIQASGSQYVSGCWSARLLQRWKFAQFRRRGMASRDQIGNDALIDVEVALVFATVANLMTPGQDSPHLGSETKRVR